MQNYAKDQNVEQPWDDYLDEFVRRAEQDRLDEKAEILRMISRPQRPTGSVGLSKEVLIETVLPSPYDCIKILGL